MRYDWGKIVVSSERGVRIMGVKKVLLGAAALILVGYAIYKGIDQDPSEYSLEWIKRLSDEDWLKEREKVQDQYRNPDLDEDFRMRCGRLLDRFDKVKRDKEWGDEEPRAPIYHREHGNNLYKPE